MVVELRARFDEEANLGLADRLQEAGVQVVYGVVGFKTHAKMLLIVRREGRKLRRYVHLGTGNYHSGTARAYTDFGLITADPDIGSDVHQIFQQMSGLAPVIKLKRLLQSPFTLHSGVLKRIERETKHAQAGKPARIIAKMNALNEPQVIRALYAASQAGVQIDLIVRGACTLRPGRAGRVGQHPRAFDRRPLPRTQPRVLVRQRRRARTCSAPAPTGWSATCCGASRPASRSSIRSWPSACLRTKRCENYLADNLNAWELQCRRQLRASWRRRDGERRHSAQAGVAG